MTPPANNPSAQARTWRLFSASPKTSRFLKIALIFPFLIFFCLVIAILANGPAAGSQLTNFQVFSLAMGFLVFPVTAILLGIAALREPHHPPRSILWLAATGLVFTAGLLITLVMVQDPVLEKTTSIVFLLIVIMPVVLLFSMPAVYSLAKTIPEILAVLKSAANERALAYISTRGVVSLVELSSLLDIPQDEVDNLLDGLLRSGALAGTLDTTRGLVFSAAYLAEKQRQLLEWVNLRGSSRIDELARLLGTSAPLVTDWIYQLVQRGQFNGYVNWSKGLVYAISGRKIGANSQCPECGGTLAPGGGQRIVCLHCGTEMWDRI